MAGCSKKRRARKANWFGSVVAQVTNDSPNALEFTPELLAAMEPHLQKARDARELGWAKWATQGANGGAVESEDFRQLVKEETVRYDRGKYDLVGAFKKGLGMREDSDLALLHELLMAAKDMQTHECRQRKLDLLARLCHENERLLFHQSFDDFVRNVVAPDVWKRCGTSVLFYQSFPCIRVILPGEFSLGPHCDMYYGHAPTNINIVVPLSRSVGCNSLYVESAPGLEDWHPVDIDVGSYKRFHGSGCIHWTCENSTQFTRVSLDFRIMLSEPTWQDRFTSSAGYYSACVRDATSGVWERKNPDLPPPSPLVGIPFV